MRSQMVRQCANSCLHSDVASKRKVMPERERATQCSRSGNSPKSHAYRRACSAITKALGSSSPSAPFHDRLSLLQCQPIAAPQPDPGAQRARVIARSDCKARRRRDFSRDPRNAHAEKGRTRTVAAGRKRPPPQCPIPPGADRAAGSLADYDVVVKSAPRNLSLRYGRCSRPWIAPSACCATWR